MFYARVYQITFIIKAIHTIFLLFLCFFKQHRHDIQVLSALKHVLLLTAINRKLMEKNYTYQNKSESNLSLQQIVQLKHLNISKLLFQIKNKDNK